MKRVTMSSVAEQAGVSKNTVSLALRHDPQIPGRTRRRIERIAKRLGYRKNPVVAQLMVELRKERPAGRRRTLALLNANLDPKAFARHPTIPAYVEGCRRRATTHGYGVDEFWLHDPELDGPRLNRILNARGIRGVLVVGLMKENRLPSRFMETWRRHATVVTGVRTHEPTLSFACVDHHALVLEAMRHATRLGYRRPALVLEGAIDRLVDGRFSAGFWVGQQLLPAENRLPGFFEVEKARTDRARFVAWFQDHHPDVIFTLHTVVREWLVEMKVSVPRRVGLVQLERRRGCADWAGMDQHNDLTGEAAVDMLVTMINNNETGLTSLPRATLIDGSWGGGVTTRSQTRGAKKA